MFVQPLFGQRSSHHVDLASSLLHQADLSRLILLPDLISSSSRTSSASHAEHAVCKPACVHLLTGSWLPHTRQQSVLHPSAAGPGPRARLQASCAPLQAVKVQHAWQHPDLERSHAWDLACMRRLACSGGVGVQRPACIQLLQARWQLCPGCSLQGSTQAGTACGAVQLQPPPAGSPA